MAIRPDPKPDTPSYYINFASVNHSEYDFTINVLRIPTHLTAEQTALAEDGKPIPVEPLLQLVVAPRLIPGLIKALTIEKEKYEEGFGEIQKTNTPGN